MKKKILVITASLFWSIFIKTSAQITVSDPGKVAERAVENRANNKVYQGVDKGLDKVEEGIGNLLFGKKKKKEQTPNNQQKTETTTNQNQQQVNSETTAEKPKNATLQTYNKFDFVPGEKLLIVEDFSQDAIGDFPDKWNTNSTGELVTVEGKKGKWLSLSKDGSFMPEYITNLPENFTLEFEIMSNEEFSFYSTALNFIIASLATPKDFTQWKRFIFDDVTGIQVGIHPMNAGSAQGSTGFDVFNKSNKPEMHNESNTSQFFATKSNYAKVSVWRQKQRLRVYLNEEKVWDLPRVLTQGVTYNALVFSLGSFHKADDRYLISNIRLAVGAPDTRNKLLTEGKFVTTGITFDVNSSIIKPESYGTLKQVADALKENPEIKIKIIGHTDADGDDASNLTLSKKRADAIKVSLSSSDFGIDATRMETDGKGESQPVGDNKTVVGKANNRRVEFVKL